MAISPFFIYQANLLRYRKNTVKNKDFSAIVGILSKISLIKIVS
jgi:hypothetical protein